MTSAALLLARRKTIRQADFNRLKLIYMEEITKSKRLLRAVNELHDQASDARTLLLEYALHRRIGDKEACDSDMREIDALAVDVGVTVGDFGLSEFPTERAKALKLHAVLKNAATLTPHRLVAEAANADWLRQHTESILELVEINKTKHHGD